MADIVISIVTKVAEYLVQPAIREGQYLLCVKNIINDLEKEKEELTLERVSLQDRVDRAVERSEVIEKPVEKWLSDVKNLLEEVADLEQKMKENNNNSCFPGCCPTLKRYHLCKQMERKINAIGKFKGQSNIQPFSHPAPLPGIRYEASSENVIYFESTKMAYNQLMEALREDCIYMIGVYGMGGSGKTTLVTEVGNVAEGLNLFDKVISFTVSQTPSIRNIQGKLADMLHLELKEESEEGRAQRIWLNLKEKKRVLVVVDDLWGEFKLRDVGIRVDNSYMGRWKVLLTTRRQEICNLMDCQKKIHLGLLSEDESWTLFQKHANIDDAMSSKSMNDVPWKLCKECKGLPVAVVAMGSSLKGKSNTEWEVALHSLKHSEAIDDHVEEGVRAALSCLKLSYDYLRNKEAEMLFLICSMFPEDHEILIEDLIRYAVGLGLGGRFSLESSRNRIQAGINKLLDFCLLMHGEKRKECVKMHDMVRDVALWIGKRSEDHKFLVNFDKPFDIFVMDYGTRDSFALASWYTENQISLQLDAPNLEILILNSASKDSLNLSHATFEGIDGLMVFSVINHVVFGHPGSLSLPQSIDLLTKLQNLHLNGWNLGEISFITSLVRLEVLDLRHCTLNELPIAIGKLKRLKLLDLSDCVFQNDYNGAVGKCLQLEELYASDGYYKYISEMVMDVITHSKLQRFVILSTQSIIPRNVPLRLEGNIHARVLEIMKLDILNLRASKRNLLQIVETVRFLSLQGGFKNISPDFVSAVGGMNGLSRLHLLSCNEIECIFDTTSEFDHVASLQLNDSSPKLVELQLSKLENLKELCRGPSVRVQRFFEKLEKLLIWNCRKLYNIFPLECNLQNLKILRIENGQGNNCMLGEVLFSMSAAQSLLQLRQLSIKNCDALKHIIASGREHGSDSSKEITQTPRKSHSVMPNLKTLTVVDCKKLESLFPLCCVEELVQLQELTVMQAREMTYVFGESDYNDDSLHQYENQIMLPRLKVVALSELENLIGLCPKKYLAKWPSQTKLNVENCPKLTMC